MSNLGYAGRVEIDELVLVKPHEQVKHDIKLFVTEVNIDASIVDASLTAEFVMFDAQNLLKKFAIEAGDIVSFTFRVNDEQRTHQLRVFKLENMQDFTKERSYSIICHSELFYKSQFTGISRAFSGSYSEIAYSIFKENTWEEYSIWEPSSLNRSFVCPNWNPIQAISWLAKNSKNTTNNTRMKFFQNTTGKYCFTSLEKIVEISQDPIWTYKYNVSTLLENGKTRTDNELAKIEHLTYDRSFDFMEDSQDRAFAAKRIQLDLSKKLMETVDFNYWTDTKPKSLLNKQGLNAVLFEGGGFNIPVTVASYSQDHIEKNYINDVSYLRESNFDVQQSITIVVKGNNIVDVGNVVEVRIPSPEPQSSSTRNEDDPYWSGKYLVAAKRDIFRKEKHTMSLTLIKDSF